MYTIAIGNAFEGLTLIGVFNSFEAAVGFADREFTGVELWNIVLLENSNNYAKKRD